MRIFQYICQIKNFEIMKKKIVCFKCFRDTFNIENDEKLKILLNINI